MTRDDFVAGFVERLHNVRQKEQRRELADEAIRVYGLSLPREIELSNACVYLEAAETELALFVFDATHSGESQ